MRFNTLVENTLNGLAKGKTLEDIAKKHDVDVEDLENQLEDEEGIKKETKEHTKGKPSIGKKIAKDHLFEDPKYYTKLNKIEKD